MRCIRRSRLRVLAGAIDAMDAAVGPVLDSEGLAKETLVLFLSDNGGALAQGSDNSPLRAGKRTAYEGGIRVPAAIRFPGRVAAGAKSQQVLAVTDLYPTLGGVARRVETDPHRGAGQGRRGGVFVPFSERSGGGEGRARCESGEGAGAERGAGPVAGAASGRRYTFVGATASGVDSAERLRCRGPFRLVTMTVCTRIFALR